MIPDTPQTLLAKLRDHDAPFWQVSWRRFFEMYREPLEVITRAIYRHHTGGRLPPREFVEDVGAVVVAEFCDKGHLRYDAAKGRLRHYLRLMINGRVVNMLKKERPFDRDEADFDRMSAPVEDAEEAESFKRALLVTLIEDLRESVPMRWFEMFEAVKLRNLPPDIVAAELGVKRGVVDNTVYKVMQKLRELAASDAYQQEYFP